MVLIKGFRATTIWKAFILNAIAASLIIFFAITIKGKLDNYVDRENHAVRRYTTWTSTIATLAFTFIATFTAYVVLYWLFGYGSSMLAMD